MLLLSSDACPGWNFSATAPSFSSFLPSRESLPAESLEGFSCRHSFESARPHCCGWLIPPQRVKGVDWSLKSTCCRCSVELLAPQSRDGWAGSWTRRRHGTSYKAALAVDFGKQHKHACMRARCLQQWRCAWGPAVWHYSQWQERSCFCLELHRQQRHNSGRVTLGDGPVNRQLILS